MNLLGRATGLLRRRRPSDADRRLVLHLGSQKTGTTAVQAWCRDHAAMLRDDDVVACTTQPEIRTALGGWYDVTRPGADARLRDYLESAWTTSRAARLFYSCESNVGPAFTGDEPSLYPRFRTAVAGVDRATAGTPRHVQFTIRSYGDFLESAYQQQLKHGRATPFAALADRVVDGLSWREHVTSLVETFGADNVTVYDYDRERPAPEQPLVGRILEDAMRWLGADRVTVGDEVSRRTNTRYTQRMADLSVEVLPLLQGADERAALHRFVTDALGRRPAADDVPASFLDPGTSAELAERYARDVAWIGSVVDVR
ncbi:hypothetical protein GCM10023216_07200 [Isoptericola chiayiensis]|uniref:Sulfotransferase family protein n=1 Tax=Isoptericola chiayiensis TaxID=579446 RepID=A0ABP8Y636_9MICO|nr:hypothetical protein [Isoptericola chiayiensis]NOV99320.1 hypothetical protein [Isoptericola chiayiensis]